MADVHRRAASSAPRLTPEEVSNRGFASAFRGVSETEVRNFLRRVADEVAAVRDRETELLEQVEALRAQLRNPLPVTEEQLLDSLGEETARVLRSAQEAAEEIRSRAEERAAALVREAQDEAARLRETAEQEATARTEEADRRATECKETADGYATRVREDAERETTELRETATREVATSREGAAAASEAELEAAKQEGRGLVAEARAVRERVLADLGRRRSLLQTQIDELRAGRDRLLDGYRVVKRTLSEATDALSQVEARAASELSQPPPPMEVPPVPGELEALAGAPEGAPEVDVEVAVAVAQIAVEATADEDSGAAVEALFARLRASGDQTAPAPDEAVTEPGLAEPGEPEPEPPAAPSGDDGLRAARAAALDPLVRELGRRAKRALQDEQNELLDRLRTVKGAPPAAEVLPDPAARRATWVEVLREPVAQAHAAGFTSPASVGTGPPCPDDLVEGLAVALVEPLGERLATAIDDAAGDEAAATSRISARYREFKGQELEAAVGDALAAAWARGAYDAAGEGTRLRWVPAVVGHCPDCDDNALEPTLRGEPFPTGQRFPPAHPGCRCLLTPADL